ncbi:MAG: ABC transporter ATP-binding protein [Thermomicrobiales bacterium]|nr:ABC transporter ATP-binding protein [Thermomicrobiales bacterium]MCO5219229.1 ABC transporter ATP-binding protein [Thermomicrobiales bacterium]MCO5225052.1 ABC transporter ATP-binding protein [Thermomicrobiales bacterium]
MSYLATDNLAIAYDNHVVVDGMSLQITEGTITTIIGPNGCGKSTLLRALARILAPKQGTVLLQGQDIHAMSTTAVARNMGLLSQQAESPDRITVSELVARGRYPHQKFLQPLTKKDLDAVDKALDLADMTSLRDAAVDELSGGQRQRAWIAMLLAQETPLMMLDEPTTYLDVAHEIEVMQLVRRLNREEGRTIVMVLHDINQAASVSDRIIAMRDGRIVADGSPDDVVTIEVLSTLYGVHCDVYQHDHHMPRGRFCMPRSNSNCGACLFAPSRPGFAVSELQTGYGKRVISQDLSLTIPGGLVTAIIGPNACGKSTLLKTIGRLQKRAAGQILLDNTEVSKESHRKLARKLAMLGQGALIPDRLTVEDLVTAGRYPRQSVWQRCSLEDERMVEWALEKCRLLELRDIPVESLSGGQRQRAWFAMSIVQDTPTLLLDEPTTFLDISAQIDLLDIVWQLNRDHGKTIVMVLHDLNLAARYADYIIAMKDGRIAAQGLPTEVIVPEVMQAVYGIESSILTDQATGMPLMIPLRGM